jgi:GT2 family glycosyltransferase
MQSDTIVTVVVVNWNGKSFISECLDGLRAQTYKSFEIVVVDNGSTDNSVDFISRSYPDVALIPLEKNYGFSKGNNIALKNIYSKYVALINNDAVPDPQWLECLVSAMEQYQSAGFVASKMVFQNCPMFIDRAGDFYTRAGAGILRGRNESSLLYSEKEWVFGACAGAAMYRKEMIEAIGPFDEDFFLLYEDIDLSFRAQLIGYKCLFVPDAVVRHKASKSIGHDSSTSVYFGHRNLEWVYLKNMPSRLIMRTFFFHFIYNVGALFYFLSIGRLKEFIRAKFDAFTNLPRILKKRKVIQKNRVVSDAYIWRLLIKENYFHRLRIRRS